MSDTPLHVRVAEVLGWDMIVQADWGGAWFGRNPVTMNMTDNIPCYDTDWSATGPLIDKYRIKVRPAAGGCWAASLDTEFEYMSEGHPASALTAVCRLILALHAAGKLAA